MKEFSTIASCPIQIGFLFLTNLYHNMDLKTDKEFKDLLPPLTDDEYSALETSILREGIREPLIVWDDTIIDGHNRYSIAQVWGVDFDIHEKDFDSREQAKDWIDENQLGRRNITPDQRRIIIGRLYNREKKSMSEAGAMKGKKSKGKNCTSSTAEKIADKENVSPRTVKNYAKDSEFFDELKEEKPEVADEVWSGKKSLSEVKKDKTVHVSNNSGEQEWYTPPKFLESAQKAMGSIDVDPASSKKANEFVKADTFYTKQNSGLENNWSGNVWMNPPYGQPEINNFIDTFYEKWESQEFNQGIVLVNNATETKWFQKLLSVAVCVCFVKGRIKYLDSDGNKSKAPLQGQAILYFGDNDDKFAYEFSNHGICVWTGV